MLSFVGRWGREGGLLALDHMWARTRNSRKILEKKKKKKKNRVLMKYCFPYLLISKLDFRRTTPGESVSSIITLSWNISFYFCMINSDRDVQLVRKYKISHIPQPPVPNWVPNAIPGNFLKFTPWNCNITSTSGWHTIWNVLSSLWNLVQLEISSYFGQR